jgi:hypothetical protein
VEREQTQGFARKLHFQLGDRIFPTGTDPLPTGGDGGQRDSEALEGEQFPKKLPGLLGTSGEILITAASPIGERQGREGVGGGGESDPQFPIAEAQGVALGMDLRRGGGGEDSLGAEVQGRFAQGGEDTSDEGEGIAIGENEMPGGGLQFLLEGEGRLRDQGRTETLPADAPAPPGALPPYISPQEFVESQAIAYIKYMEFLFHRILLRPLVVSWCGKIITES